MFQTTNQMISNELFTICMLHVVLFAILKKDTSPAKTTGFHFLASQLKFNFRDLHLALHPSLGNTSGGNIIS